MAAVRQQVPAASLYRRSMVSSSRRPRSGICGAVSDRF